MASRPSSLAKTIALEETVARQQGEIAQLQRAMRAQLLVARELQRKFGRSDGGRNNNYEFLNGDNILTNKRSPIHKERRPGKASHPSSS